LLIIVGSYCESYAKVKQGQCVVRHYAILDALKDHIGSGGEIPQNLSELALLEYGDDLHRRNLSTIISFEKDRCDFKYYPDAWNKPGRILLQSSVLGSYVVLFGNGSRATLSYWDYKDDEKEQDQLKFSTEEYYFQARGCLGTVPVLVLFILLVVSFFIIVVVQRVMKRWDAKV